MRRLADTPSIKRSEKTGTVLSRRAAVFLAAMAPALLAAVPVAAQDTIKEVEKAVRDAVKQAGGGDLFAGPVDADPNKNVVDPEKKKSFKILGKHSTGYVWECIDGDYEGLRGGPLARRKQAKEIAGKICDQGFGDDSGEPFAFGAVGEFGFEDDPAAAGDRTWWRGDGNEDDGGGRL